MQLSELETLKPQLKAIALQTPEIESCALIVRVDGGDTLEVVPCKNIAGLIGKNPKHAIAVDPTDEAKAYRLAGLTEQDFDSHNAQGRIELFHSHGQDAGATLSFEDIQNSKRSSIPYISYDLESLTDNTAWDYYIPDDLNPFPLKARSASPTQVEFYLGWEWQWSRADCYVMMKNYFRGVLGIDLPEVDRTSNPLEYRKAGWNKFEEGLAANDFARLEHGAIVQLHDVILMNVDGAAPHHCGILVDVVQNHMIHHDSPERLSERITYVGGYVETTTGIYRHRSLWQ